MSQKSNVTQLKPLIIEIHTNPELISGLGYSVDEAINGNADAAIVSLRKNQFHHEVMILGAYNQDPYSALRALKKIKVSIDQQIEHLEHCAKIELEY